jgi:phosphonate transport system substrate-binding protein
MSSALLTTPKRLTTKAVQQVVAPLRLVSLLSASMKVFYIRLSHYLSTQTALDTEFLTVPWQEGLKQLERGDVQGGFLCGLLLTQQPDLEPIAAPVHRGQRYRGQSVYFSDIVVRLESDFETFEELRGARWAYNEPNSFSGYVALSAHLAQQGKGADFFGSLQQSGSHVNSLELLLEDKVDATAIDSTVLDWELQQRPELQGELWTVQSLGPYPVPPVAVRRDVPKKQKELLREALLTLHETKAGQAVLDFSPFTRYVPAFDETYGSLEAIAEKAQPFVRQLAQQEFLL